MGVTTAIVRDIPKLYTACTEWLSCVLFLCLLKRRYDWRKLVLPLAAVLVLLCVLQYMIGYELPLVLWVPGMFLAMVIMYFTIYFCCQVTPKSAGVCLSIAFILAEFAAAFEWQMYSYFLAVLVGIFDISGIGSQVFEVVIAALFYLAIYLCAYYMEKKLITDGESLSVTFSRMCIFLLIMLAIFLAANISYISSDTPFSATDQPQIFYIRSLMNFAGLFVLWSQQSIIREMNLFKELEMTQNVLMRQYYQYKQSKESIEILNCKYHDLKNQINMIRSETDAGKKEEYLQEMEQGIQKFELENKTGSPVLDVVLTDKGMVCAQRNIRITTVADGNLLSFMNAMDICTIFGNALDNAIEYLEKVNVPEKRLIRVSVFSQQAFLVIRVKNYCDTGMVMEKELPVTTKADKVNHGYGLKSIRMSAEKYGGNMTISTEHEWFSLCVMIPFPDDQAPPLPQKEGK
ncbi:MAG: GHKL domain-containing protein [Lachnospiraceae bacterium]|nr:GHKL domain-containing protein [Lachnospiraceae bacterium]